MKKSLVFSGLVALAGASGALFVTDASADWNGFYGGANVGYGDGDTSWSNIIVPSEPAQNYEPEFSSSSPSGAVGGVHAGWNSQNGEWVFGFEGGISFGNLDGTHVCFGSPSYGDYYADCKTEVNWMGDLAFRAGFTPSDRALVYVKAGVSLADVDFAPKNEFGTGGRPATGGYGTSNERLTGLLLGIGGEYMVNPKLSLGLEYVYRDFGDEQTHFRPTGLLNEYNPPFSATTDLKINSIVARVSYKF